MAISHDESKSAIKDLKPLLSGQLVLPMDERYDQARRIWNGMIDKRPQAIVYCATTQDVIHTLRWARERGLPLAVRGGGHDVGGRALCNDGVVIDCSGMNNVTVNAEERIAHVEGGATVQHFVHASQKYGLGGATGNVESVGLAGLMLGGGYGPLVGKLGLVADNLLSAQIVTADGKLVTASAEENPDLLWGLKGGGGNYGVVVSLNYRLVPLSQVLFGWRMYPLAQAREVMQFYQEFISTAPDELTILSGLLKLPDGSPIIFLAPTYSGPLEEGERILQPVRAFGKPLADQIQPTSYEAVIAAINSLVPKGRRYFMHTESIEKLRPEAIEVIVGMAERFTSPYSAITIHHFHGAASRVGVSDTAFALRRDHLMVDIASEWEADALDEDEKHMAWTRIAADLAPYSVKGGYVNLLCEDEQDRVDLAFGPNLARLLKLKMAYDPEDVFRSTIGHVIPTVAR